MGTDYLVRSKTGQFSYRRRVPRVLRGIIGKTEIIRSLKTSTLAVAKVRLARFNAEIEAIFAKCRQDGELSDHALFEQELTRLRGMGLSSLDQLNPENRAMVESSVADTLLEQNGYSSLDEWAESRSNGPQDSRLSAQLSILLGGARRPEPTLSYVAKELIANKGRKKAPSDLSWRRYKQERERMVSWLINNIGSDKDVSQITRQEARTALETLEDHEGYAPDSVRKQLSFFRNIVAFAQQEWGLTFTDPFKDLRPAQGTEDLNYRESLTFKEIHHMLANRGSMNDDLQDILVVLAYTGARLNEIAGLSKTDLSLQAEFPHIEIVANSIRSIKTRSSKRAVPLLGEALAIIKRRVSRLGNQPGETPLFPRYGREKGGDSASAALNKWRVNIAKIDRPRITIHSLRHTMKDALREANVHRDIADMIQGHTAGDASSRYGTNELLKAKHEGLSKALLVIGFQP